METLEKLLDLLAELGIYTWLMSIIGILLTFIAKYLFIGNLFRKAGYKRYISIIPYYCSFTYTLIATGSEGWAVCAGIPFTQPLGLLYANLKIFPTFGSSLFFGICYLIFPLRGIYYIGLALIALNDKPYIGPAPGWDVDEEEDEDEFGESIADERLDPIPKSDSKPKVKKVKKVPAKKVPAKKVSANNKAKK